MRFPTCRKATSPATRLGTRHTDWPRSSGCRGRRRAAARPRSSRVPADAEEDGADYQASQAARSPSAQSEAAVNATPFKASLACVVGAASSACRRLGGAQRAGAPPGQTLRHPRAAGPGLRHDAVYMLVGAGGNIVVQIGDEGVVMVDTGVAGGRATRCCAAIRTLTDKPIRYVINTHAHPDHVGGNEVDRQGERGPAHRRRRRRRRRSAEPERRDGVRAPEHRGRDAVSAAGQHAVPRARGGPVVVHYRDKQLHFNGEAIELWWHPSAHTNGDVLVYFPRSDVIVAGDLLQMGRFRCSTSRPAGGCRACSTG